MLSTPALVLDLDVLERNVASLADHCRTSGIGLRPHAKTHKSAAIARMQLDAGAVGICCAKVSEAEALAAGGIGRILVTSPVVTERAAARIAALASRLEHLVAVIDSTVTLELLASAAAGAGVEISVLVDVNVGTMRTGAPERSAVELGRRAAAAPSLRFAGLQGYAGHVMHVTAAASRREASHEALAVLARVRDGLRAAGIESPIVTGGGTGTYDVDAQAGVLTDLQAGSYVFMDREYEDVEWAGGRPPFERSLFVHTTVISANQPGLCTTDAGFKAFATDGPKPAIHDGAPAGSSYAYMGDEHGAVVLPSPEHRLEPGALVVCTPPHCDPTVNLYDAYHCVRGDTLVDVWPVDARGCTR